MKKFYLYFNNHFASKAVVNAVMIKKQLGEPVRACIRRSSSSAIPKPRRSYQQRRRRSSCSSNAAGVGRIAERQVSGWRYAAAGANTARTAAKASCSSAGTSRTATARSADTSTSATTATSGGCGSSPIEFRSASGSSFCFSDFGSRRWWMGVLFFGSLVAAAAADDSPAIRPRDRDHLSDPKAMAGPKKATRIA